MLATGITLATLEAALADSDDGRRFLEKVKLGDVPQPDIGLGPCIVWTRSTDPDGYPTFRGGERGQTVSAHTWLYRRLFGAVPDGMELDHVCHDRDYCQLDDACPHRRCVIHTIPVVHRDNWARSGAITVYHATKEFCDGDGGTVHHPLSGSNLKLLADGERRCYACDARRQREYAARKRLLQARLHHLGLREAGYLSLLQDV